MTNVERGQFLATSFHKSSYLYIPLNHTIQYFHLHFPIFKRFSIFFYQKVRITLINVV